MTKISTVDDAYSAGRDAALAGCPLSNPPVQADDLFRAWLRGFREHQTFELACAYCGGTASAEPDPRALIPDANLSATATLPGPGAKYSLISIPAERLEDGVLDGATWADWDHDGRLVFARDGKLFRMRADRPLEFQLLSDFHDRKPSRLIAPEWAYTW